MIRLHVVAETPTFLRDAKGLSEEARAWIVDHFARHPASGDEVVGSGGVRKARVSGRGKGKSGGYRVMAVYIGIDAPVYLIALLSKGERANFSAAEIRGFKALAAEIKAEWRARRK